MAQRPASPRRRNLLKGAAVAAGALTPLSGPV